MYAFKPTSYKPVDIYNSETGTQALSTLLEMKANPAYLTVDSFTTDTVQYPNGVIPFEKKHMLYMHKHPAVNPAHYLSNLRLQLKIR